MGQYAEILSDIDAQIAEVCRQHNIVEIVWSDDGMNSYHIKHLPGRFTCTCPGFMNRRQCHHVKEYIERHGGPLFSKCAFCHQPKPLNSSKYCCGRCEQLAHYAEVKKGDAIVKAMAAK